MPNINETYQVFTYTKDSVHVVNAKHRASNTLVGELVWTEPKGRVEGVQVHPDHIEEGVSTMMWDEAYRYAEDNEVSSPKDSSSKDSK